MLLNIKQEGHGNTKKQYFKNETNTNRWCHEMLSLFTQPFHKESFDFSDANFFEKIAALSHKYSKDTEIREMNGNRGSKHFLYINRTFFGIV